MKKQANSLTESTGRALTWNYLGAITRVLLGFGVNVLLTRMLGPGPFGVFAVAMLVYGFGFLLAAIGVGSALIQRADLTERDIRFSFSSQMLIAAALSVALFFSAPLFAAFFRQPGLTPVLRVISPIFLFQSFGATSAALLNRAQNTRAIQIAMIVSYLLAFPCISLPMAVLGYGVWSLVAGYLVQALFYSLLLFAQARHSLVPLLHRDGVPLFKFGLFVLGANICSWGISNLDNTVVGRMNGPIALGLYSRAFSLALLPSDIIISNLQQVMLPAFSRVQGDRGRVARAFLATFGLVAILLLPPFCAMAAVPHLVILGLFGSKWVGAVEIFRPLALALPIHGLMGLAGPTLAARGKPRIELWCQLPVFFIALFGYLASARISLLCLSWTVLGVYAIRFIILTSVALRELGVAWFDVWGVSWPAIVVAVVATSSAYLVSVIGTTQPYPFRLTLAVAVSGGFTLLVVITGRRRLLDPIFHDTPQIKNLLYEKFKPMLILRAQ